MSVSLQVFSSDCSIRAQIAKAQVIKNLTFTRKYVGANILNSGVHENSWGSCWMLTLRAHRPHLEEWMVCLVPCSQIRKLQYLVVWQRLGQGHPTRPRPFITWALRWAHSGVLFPSVPGPSLPNIWLLSKMLPEIFTQNKWYSFHGFKSWIASPLPSFHGALYNSFYEIRIELNQFII